MTVSPVLHPTLARLLILLAQEPWAERVVVFGSVARGTDRPEGPSDLDIVYDASHATIWTELSERSDDAAALRTLLRLARRHYGWFDPFVRLAANADVKLVVRNDHATGWQRAKNSRSLLNNISTEGCSLFDVVRRYGLHATPTSPSTVPGVLPRPTP